MQGGYGSIEIGSAHDKNTGPWKESLKNMNSNEVIYQDDRGYLFRVQFDGNYQEYRGYFNRGNIKYRWDRMSHSKPRATKEEAQRDLDEQAIKKGWKVYE